MISQKKYYHNNLIMSLHAVNIQGINITSSSKKEILEEVRKYLVFPWKQVPKPRVIVTPNPEQIVYAREDSHFAELLNQADIAIPDGIGLVWANPSAIKETIPGVEFMEELVVLAVKQHVPIALIGGKTKVAVDAFECLRQNHPDLRGVAMETPDFTIMPSGLSMDGSIDAYFKKLAKTLAREQIGIVFVALGAPKQEYFIEKLRTQNSELRPPIVLMSVGGSLDEISGRVPRAPAWVRRVGMKWLWRLIMEPWRIKRQVSLLQFIWMVMKERHTLK